MGCVSSQAGTSILPDGEVLKEGWMVYRRRKDKFKQKLFKLIKSRDEDGEKFHLVAIAKKTEKVSDFLSFRRCLFKHTCDYILRRSEDGITISTQYDSWQLRADIDSSEEEWFNALRAVLVGRIECIKEGYLTVIKGGAKTGATVTHKLLYRLLPASAGPRRQAFLASFSGVLDEVPRDRYYLGDIQMKERNDMAKELDKRRSLGFDPSGASYEFKLNIFKEEKSGLLKEKKVTFKATSRADMCSWIRKILHITETQFSRRGGRRRVFSISSEDDKSVGDDTKPQGGTKRVLTAISLQASSTATGICTPSDGKELRKRFSFKEDAANDARPSTVMSPPPGPPPRLTLPDPRQTTRSPRDMEESAPAPFPGERSASVSNSARRKEGKQVIPDSLPDDVKMWTEDNVLTWARQRPSLKRRPTIIRRLEAKAIDGIMLLEFRTEADLEKAELGVDFEDHVCLLASIRSLKASSQPKQSATSKTSVSWHDGKVATGEDFFFKGLTKAHEGKHSRTTSALSSPSPGRNLRKHVPEKRKNKHSRSKTASASHLSSFNTQPID